MKKIAIMLILLWSAVAGAVPNTISFSGRLATSTGPVTGSVNLTFKLYDAATAGTALWTETHSNLSTDDGLVFVDAGMLTTLDETILDGRKLYLEVTVETETLAPRLAINSVPYAVRAAAAKSADLLGGVIGPGDVITSVTGSSGVVATKTGNAMAVSLSTTGCTSGQVYKYNGTTFSCQPDANTTYTAGPGITISASNQILPQFDSDGVSNLVARSDHTHSINATIGFNHSHLPTNEWHCSVSGGTLTVQAAAICCVNPIVSNTLSCSQVLSAGGPDVSAVCPAGRVLTGGGCDINGGWIVQ